MDISILHLKGEYGTRSENIFARYPNGPSNMLEMVPVLDKEGMVLWYGEIILKDSSRLVIHKGMFVISIYNQLPFWVSL